MLNFFISFLSYRFVKNKSIIMSSNSSSSSSGIGFTGLLTILFIGLKLTGYINWSWWWVLSPVWISIGIVLLVVAFLFWIKSR